MSKSKSKSSKGDVKSEKVLTEVKNAAVTKPSQTPKVKSKEIAKLAVAKDQKKSKNKKVKEPTPEPSDESEDESDASASSESEDESEAEVTKPALNGKVNGGVNGAASDSESDDDDSKASESSESSDDEVPANRVVGKATTVKNATADSSDEDESDSDSEDTKVAGPATSGVKVAEDSEEDDSEEDSDEDEEEPAKTKGPVKANELSTKITPIASTKSSNDDSEEDSEESEADSEDSEDEAGDESNDSDEESEEEVEAKPAKSSKRKAEEEAPAAAKKTKTEDIDTSQGSNLFIGNLSWNVDEDWLKSEFAEFGELASVRLITDRDTGRSKGFGYVEFTNAADAAKAHKSKNGAEIDGRAANVDFANSRGSGDGKDRSQARAKSYGDQTSPASDTLFVGNLSFDVTQDGVSDAFSEYGTILGVRLPTDRDTGGPKGFGYVNFSSIDEATVAMEAMQGYELMGRAIRLDFSQPRPQNGDSPMRGGRGGGRGFGDRGGRGGGRGRGGFGDRGGRGGGRGRGGFGDRGGRGGRGGSTNRGGFGDYQGKKMTF